MAKYYFESSTTGEIFRTPVTIDDFIIQTIIVEAEGYNGGFDIYLVDTQLEKEFYLLSTTTSNLNINMNVQEGQQIKIVTRKVTQLNKILILGKIY